MCSHALKLVRLTCQIDNGEGDVQSIDDRERSGARGRIPVLLEAVCLPIVQRIFVESDLQSEFSVAGLQMCCNATWMLHMKTDGMKLLGR